MDLFNFYVARNVIVKLDYINNLLVMVKNHESTIIFGSTEIAFEYKFYFICLILYNNFVYKCGFK